MSSLPLAGITIIAVEQAVAAPLATRHLADLGARVIKIERSDGGDFARQYDETVNGLASHFVWLNRGKESVCLDLHQPAGLELFLSLVDGADAVVQNLAPGAADRLGIGADALRARKPELIVVNITGYGQGGPRQNEKAYDLLIQAEAGLIAATGTAEHAVKTGFPAADIATGMYVCISVLGALTRRLRTGEGATVDVAMFDATLEWLSTNVLTWLHQGEVIPRMGNSHAAIAPYTVYPTADGEIFIGVQNDSGWRSLVSEALEAPELANHPIFRTNILRVRHRDKTDAVVGERTRRYTTASLRIRLAAAGVPCAQLNDIGAVVEHPQLAARDRWRGVATEAGTIRSLLPPMTFRDVELPMGAVPALGEHTDAVMAEIAGRAGREPTPSSEPRPPVLRDRLGMD